MLPTATFEKKLPLGAPPPAESPVSDLGVVDSFTWLVTGNQSVSPWWSTTRDRQLNQFWQASDHLSSAIYNMVAKMTAIPFRIRPRNSSIQAHITQAEQFENALRNNSEYLEGFDSAYSKFLHSLLTQDNGGFWLILGDGPADGPIIGAPSGVIHLDASRCTRTNSLIYPVIYLHTDNKRYKLHHTRVMFKSQMPSTKATMNGVGFCAVSRSLRTAQFLIDIDNYKAERMGSRPPRVMLVGSGITGKEIREAFAIAELDSDNAGLRRYSKIVAVGSTEPGTEIKKLELTTAPEGFSEKDSVALSMFTIALALGVDARELWPASASGATKADAMVQHLKARGKGPGQIIAMIEHQMNLKYLPPHLELVFDYIDDEQDRARAEIREMRARQRKIDLDKDVLTLRVAREQMLEDGEISASQFEEMELADGRLEDGSDVLLLFNSTNQRVRSLLDVGVARPLRVSENNAASVLEAIQERVEEVQTLAYNTSIVDSKRVARQCLAALLQLKDLYSPKNTAPMASPDSELIMNKRTEDGSAIDEPELERNEAVTVSDDESEESIDE